MRMKLEVEDEERKKINECLALSFRTMSTSLLLNLSAVCIISYLHIVHVLIICT